jgi:hypothetical protein
MRRIPSLLSLAALLVAGLAAPPSSATVVLAISLPELVAASEHVVVAVPTSSRSHWETMGGSRRIVTDTELEVDQSLRGGAAAGSILEVRTLGGTVDEIAQYVPGEAPLRHGKTAVVFLDAGGDGALHVTAMAQGHYPLSPDDTGTLRLTPSPGLDGIRGPENGAVAALTGRTVEQVRGLIGTVKRAL